MRNHRILAAALAGLLLLPLTTSCRKVSDIPPADDPSAGGTNAPAVLVTTKPKTPTPQAEFDPGKYPGQSGNPGGNPGWNPPAPEIPQYPVDFVPDPALDGYTDLTPLVDALHAANASFSEDEQAFNLFDGYESSKYCAPMGEDGTIEVVWSMNGEMSVAAYAFVTGNDTSEYPDRNPVSWELYGSADGAEESWQLIDSAENSEIMPAENYAYKGFVLAQSVRYQYFRIIFHKAENQAILQLSELHLYTDDPASAGFADADAPEGTKSLFGLIDRSTIAGPGGAGNHTADCLFDNLAKSGAAGSNKYCVGGSNVTVEWQMTEQVVITDYVVYTANDTETYPDRNPVRWTLYGSADGENYEVVHEVNDAGLPLTNYTPTAYSTGCTTAYSFYRLEMHTVEGAGTFQLSEICLFTRN